jgi:GGDEF domain-containing protein
MHSHDPRMEVPAATPADRLARAARAAHELSEALWSAMHEELALARAAAPAAGATAAASGAVAASGAAVASGAAATSGAVAASGTAVSSGTAAAFGAADLRWVAELSRRLADVSCTIALLTASGLNESPPADAPAPDPVTPPEPESATPIAIRDVRHDEQAGAELADEWANAEFPAEPAPGGWIGAIARRLQRYSEDRMPFAVLLIEVAELDRLAHVEPARELERLTALLERALGEELRPADLLTRESRGRYWLITPETDGAGARLLAQRLARVVQGTVLHRGVGLQVAIGIAVCPDDGLDAAGLAAHADVGVYAARACGMSLAPDDDMPPSGATPAA